MFWSKKTEKGWNRNTENKGRNKIKAKSENHKNLNGETEQMNIFEQLDETENKEVPKVAGVS